MKKQFLIITALLLLSSLLFSQKDKSFHSLEALTINGETKKMSDFKGKRLLVVNVASKCGLTPQYSELQELYSNYGGEKFEIIAFPANDFLSQEPGTNEEIKEFCESNFGVTFQLMDKITVKGKEMHPVYQWLTTKKKNKVSDNEVQWNFQKYLIDAEGNFVELISPRESPMSEKIVKFAKGE